MTSKTKIFALVAICSISLFSCKKDYDCDCTISFDAGMGVPFNVNQSTKIEKTSKKGAEGTCDNIETNLKSTITLLGGSATCQLD